MWAPVRGRGMGAGDGEAAGPGTLRHWSESPGATGDEPPVTPGAGRPGPGAYAGRLLGSGWWADAFFFEWAVATAPRGTIVIVALPTIPPALA